MPLALAIPEQALQATILEAAQYLHYLAYHPYDSRRSTPGYFDLILLGHGACYFLELKSATGRLTPAQQQWQAAAQAVTAPPRVEVVRPQDLSRLLDDLQQQARRARLPAW
jgi:hypothetical protein